MHTIIVGAGIAGLWLAEQLALKGDKVTLLEKSDYLGGRVITSKLGFEIGAGRVATTHKHVVGLIKRFKLTSFPLPEGDYWKALGDKTVVKNPFNDIWAEVLNVLAKLDPKLLANNTLRDLTTRLLGPELTEHILLQFPYRAETEVMRADLGLQTFRGDMGAKARFIGVKGGLSLIIAGLEKACRAAGVTIRMSTKVTNITDSFKVHTDDGILACDRVVLAVPVEALKHIPSMQSLPVLKHLKMEPLTRIYAKFATAWTLSKKLITDSPLRFIIPIIPELGLIMISYTEGQDTQHFKGLKGLQLMGALSQEISRLFPNEIVPLIVWAEAYEWSYGCSYWLPGDYDPVAESRKALQPVPGKALHLCNESYSNKQVWMEGSLQHANVLFKLLQTSS